MWNIEHIFWCFFICLKVGNVSTFFSNLEPNTAHVIDDGDHHFDEEHILNALSDE